LAVTASHPDEEVLFNAARHIGDGAARARYLREAAGGDEGLLRRVEALLAVHDAPDRLLDRPAGAGGATGACGPAIGDETASILPRECARTPIGPYKLLQQIGEGGMGVVWMAEQTRPVQRKVALKVIKPGMDSRQVVARFEAERQALAIMDHPHIAKVFDGGETASGRPYFVMELVKGVPITDFCDQNHLGVRERLGLFVDVCQAVQHAHHKGIIHRDLKPSNVLVTVQDTTPVVKVIDFGVAKALGQELTGKTVFTSLAQMVGTPLYMSPEQAGMSDLDVDTRSDIYALGVLLYELLTGTTPFDKQRLRAAGYDEIRRIIREEEPPRPSTKLSTAEGLPTLAANRGTEPAKLTKLVRGELDWIVMKALEKDRNRRYETANGFALDVQRYLADEPVLACPPSAGYRLRKFARRNKGGLAVTALVLFFLVLLGSGVGWTAREWAARQGRIGAQADLILGEVDLLEKEQKWPEALAVAQRAEALTAGGADAATQERIRQVLHSLRMVARLEEVRVREAPGAEPRAVHADEGRPRRYAAAFRDFGVDVETLPAEESAARLRARPAVAIPLAAALDDWASVGRRQAPDQAKRLWALAAAVDPDPWRVSVRQASVAMDVEALLKLANAADTAWQPPQSQLLLASSLRLCGQGEQARALLERTCEIHPGDFWIHYSLAWLSTHVSPARLEAAVRHRIAARALRPRNPVAWLALGYSLQAQGKPDEAIACYRKAIELDLKFARAHYQLADALRHNQGVDAAIPHYRKAIEFSPTFALAHANLGGALLEQGKVDEAIPSCRKAVELDPKFTTAYLLLGYALQRQRKPDEAIAAFEEAIRLKPDHAGAYHSLGAILRDSKHDYEGAIACFNKFIELRPNNAQIHHDLVDALTKQGRLDETIASYRKLIQRDPNNPQVHHRLGVAVGHQGKLDDAIAAYREALRLKPDFTAAQEHLNNVAWHFASCADPKARDPKRAAELVKHLLALNPNPELLARCAPMLLLADDTDTYRQLCVHVIGQLGDTKDPRTAYLVARIGALAPDAVPDPTRLVEIAERAVRVQPAPHYLHVLGLAHYRAGQLDTGIKQLRRSIEGNWTANAANWLVLAMAHQRLGHAEEARKWLDKAVRWIDNTGREAPRGSVDALRSLHRHDSLACMVLRREAETLLGAPPRPAPEEKEAPGEKK
jgi:serine/threonine protein kinase/Flp pilus assembly protein TadD